MKMKRLFAAATVAALLAAYGGATGVAVAEPGKNRITVPDAECDDGQTRTLVVNAMGKSVDIAGDDASLIVKEYTLTYSDPTTGDPLGVEEYGGGQKKGLDGRLITCEGQTTTEIFGLGLVTIDYDLRGFLTPGR